jgi:hypothetical protein
MRRVLLVGVVAVLAAGACGDDAEAPPEGLTYDDAAAMAEVLGCDGSFEETTPGSAEGIDAIADTSGRCDFAGTVVSIETYASNDEAAEVLPGGEAVVCSFMGDLGFDRVHYAAGPNWFVTPEDPDDADAAAEAAELLDGEARELDCG